MVTNKNYPSIIKKHKLRITRDRLGDFRNTMKQIVDLKNGKMMPDAEWQEDPGSPSVPAGKPFQKRNMTAKNSVGSDF